MHYSIYGYDQIIAMMQMSHWIKALNQLSKTDWTDSKKWIKYHAVFGGYIEMLLYVITVSWSDSGFAHWVAKRLNGNIGFQREYCDRTHKHI